MYIRWRHTCHVIHCRTRHCSSRTTAPPTVPPSTTLRQSTLHTFPTFLGKSCRTRVYDFPKYYFSFLLPSPPPPPLHAREVGRKRGSNHDNEVQLVLLESWGSGGQQCQALVKKCYSFSSPHPHSPTYLPLISPAPLLPSAGFLLALPTIFQKLLL